MNFLAHFLLSQPTAPSRAGNFLGDFITGTPESLKEKLPPDLLEGIIMHRHVDAFTDSHPSFKKAKLLLPMERRRFAGIILDIFTDHFLAKDWHEYSEQPLEDFQREVFSQLHDQWKFFPKDAKKLASWMEKENWFLRYKDPSHIDLVLTRMSQRRPKFTPIADGYNEFLENYESFRVHSKETLADALAHFKNAIPHCQKE